MSDKVASELKSIEIQIADKITSVLDDLIENGKMLSLAEGIEKLSGLPNEFVPALAATLAAKDGIDLDWIANKKSSSFVFNLIVTGAAIGFAEGRRVGRGEALDVVSERIEAIADQVRQQFAKRQATSDAKAASESASEGATA